MSEPEHPSAEALWRQDDPGVPEHLEGCPRCRDSLRDITAEQRQVRQWLESSVPVTMPDHVADRMQRAISAQADERFAQAHERAVVAPVPRDQRSASRSVPRQWLLAASVAAVSVVGAALVVPQLVGSGGDDSSASAPAAGEATAPERDAAESAGDTAASAPEGLPPVPGDLVEQALGPAAGAPVNGCGEGLASQLDAELRSVTNVDDARGGVLVVLDEQGTIAVWWLPTCSATADEAFGRTQAP